MADTKKDRSWQESFARIVDVIEKVGDLMVKQLEKEASKNGR